MAQATGSTAIQLPDLASYVRPFGLRTNSRCKWASDTSIEHLSSVSLIDRGLLCAVKGGLLASLCFPTCDGSQLRAATDFMTIWMIQYTRHTRGDVADCEPYQDLANLESLGSFQYALPGLRLLCANQSDEWNRHFIASLNHHRRAQSDRQLQSGSDTVVPTIDGYMSSLDEYSGVYVILDMVELVEGLRIPEHTDESQRFRSTAARIISYVLDIVSFNTAQSSVPNSPNLIAVIMAQESLSLQAALQYAGDMIKDAITDLSVLETSLMRAAPASSWSSLIWRRPQAANPTEMSGEDYDMRLWVRGIKDCISGIVNWANETELFFGTTGANVRDYGWVFLYPQGHT
ncbi:isoprenoid synthase domain-containing protein [Mucidula mucida]|nr:isoprenoid synthase domain-containing protein [Mucidula mucida]